MTPLKTGDPCAFEHQGRNLKGTVLEVLPDGRIRVKDERGYMYRYQPENVRHVGEPAKPQVPIPPPQPQDSSNSNTNNQTTEPMAKKKDAPQAKAKADPKAETTTNPALIEQAKRIAALTCKKHQKIYLLHSAGLEKADVMKYAGCNAGELSNVRKDYSDKPEKVKAAEALLA